MPGKEDRDVEGMIYVCLTRVAVLIWSAGVQKQ